MAYWMEECLAGVVGYLLSRWTLSSLSPPGPRWGTFRGV